MPIQNLIVYALRTDWAVVLLVPDSHPYTDCVGEDVDDQGMTHPDGLGLWVWVDEGSKPSYDYETQVCDDVSWRGSWRRPTADELSLLTPSD